MSVQAVTVLTDQNRWSVFQIKPMQNQIAFRPP
jgi:hypothetical protein